MSHQQLLWQDAAQTGQLGNGGAGKVENILFNGANSQLILRDQASGAQMNIVMPQTGEFRDLTQGDVVAYGWEPQQTRVYSSARGQHGL